MWKYFLKKSQVFSQYLGIWDTLIGQESGHMTNSEISQDLEFNKMW